MPIGAAASFEAILHNCQTRRGTYLLGAGASVGFAPFGAQLYRMAALDLWHNADGFPPEIPNHSALNQKIIASQIETPFEEIWGRELRSGTEPSPTAEMLWRLPNNATRLRVKHDLVRARHECRAADSYRVFRAFHPSIIMNYNHDGLAAAQCGDMHRVIDIHMAIDPWFGSSELDQFIPIVRKYNLPVPSDGLIMCEPERPDDNGLKHRLRLAGSLQPQFVAVIGYSFAKVDNTYDDFVSWYWFNRQFHHHRFAGPIYVIGPAPEELQYAIAELTKSPSVIGVPARWNILSHAFLLHLLGRGLGRSIYATHEILLSRFGGEAGFPREAV